MHRRTLLLISVCVSGCATYYPVTVIPGDSASQPVRSVYIELAADGRDAKKLQAQAAEAIHRELPSVRVVDHVALADAMLSWSIQAGHPCVDCGECCPDKYFFRQATHYLRTHGSYPFAQASSGRLLAFAA